MVTGMDSGLCRQAPRAGGRQRVHKHTCLHMPVHHLALRSSHPFHLAAFYARALDLPELRRQEDADGPYSVWLDLGGAVLMVERGESHATDAGWDGLFLAAAPGTGEVWAQRWSALGIALDGRTGSTLYARDPEGNRFGVSSYPIALF